MSRNGWGRCVAFVACMAVVALSGAKTARAQDQPAAPGQPAVAGKPVADVLPESTIALVEVHDIDATRLRGKDNILAKLLNDPQVAAYLKPLEDKINAYAQMLDAQMQANVQVSMNDIKQLLNGRIAVAVTDLSFLGPGPQPKIVVVITPKDTEFLKAFVARILLVLPPDARQTIVTRRVGNVEVSELATGGMGPPINWAIAGNTLVVGLGTAAADDVVQRMANGGPSLSANPTFAQMREKLADYDQDWMYYVSFDRVIGMIRAVGGEDAMKLLAISGIGDLKAIGAAAKLNGPAVDDRLYVLFAKAPAPGRLQAILSPKPLSAELLRMAPAAADSIAVSRFNVPFAFTVFTEIFGEMSPVAYAEYQKDVEQADLALGISLEDDFFKAMGDEMMVYNATLSALSAEELEKRIAAAQNPEQKGLALIAAAYENVIAVFTVTDSARIQKSMKAFADSALSALKGEGGVPEPEIAGVHSTDLDHGGVTLHMLEGIPNFPLRPGYAVTAKQLIFAGSEKALASAVDLSRAAQVNGENSPVWSAVQAEIAKDAGAVSVEDVRPGMELLMLTLKETALPQVVPLLNQGGPPDPALAEMLTKDPLPAMRQALKANPLITVTTVTSDSDGVALTGHTMLGSTSFIVPAAAVAGAILPALARAREEARRAQCATNLGQIGRSIGAWQGAHNDELPPSLADLMPAYLQDPMIFKCPSAGDEPQPPGKFQTDYNYVGWLPANVAGANTVIAYDKPENHGTAGVNCLFFDGHVSWFSGANFRARLEQSFVTIKPWADQQPADVQNLIKEFYQVAP